MNKPLRKSSKEPPKQSPEKPPKNSPMQVAYLTGEYPRVTDTFIQLEVAELRRLGATVKPYSVRRPRDEQSLSLAQKQERDRTTYLLPANPLSLLTAHLNLLTKHPSRYVSAISLAWKTRQLGIRGTLYQLIYFIEAGLLAHRLHQHDISHLHNHIGDSSGTVTMLASALGNFGYSFTLHGPGIFFEPKRWRIDEKIARAQFVNCISQFCRSQAMIFAPIESWPKLKIVHCGVNPESFNPESSSPPNAQSDSLSAAVNSGKHLLYVGRLAAAKGLPILLQSLSKLTLDHPDIHLTVVGDGPDRKLLENQVRHLSLADHVDFVGYQPPAEVRRYLRATDIFVMSSFAEGVPVVLMEAMMAARPVVATQIAGISELVENGVNGFLVPPSDPQQLGDRIHKLLANSALRQQFGQQGQQKVSAEFNIHREAKKLYQLIDAAIEGHSVEDLLLRVIADERLSRNASRASELETPEYSVGVRN